LLAIFVDKINFHLRHIGEWEQTAHRKDAFNIVIYVAIPVLRAILSEGKISAMCKFTKIWCKNI